MNGFQQELPPPPPAFFAAIKQARRQGYWLKASRKAIPGQHRYILTMPNGSQPVFGSDDLDEIRDWLRQGG